jgi:hypothetical protein
VHKGRTSAQHKKSRKETEGNIYEKRITRRFFHL